MKDTMKKETKKHDEDQMICGGKDVTYPALKRRVKELKKLKK